MGEIADLSSKRPFWWRERGIAPGHGFQGDRLHAEITAAEETAVEWSLDWLTRHQLPDGSWSLKGYTHRCTDATCSGPGIIDADSAATAMGLLPFLAHGETGKHARVVVQRSRLARAASETRRRSVGRHRACRCTPMPWPPWRSARPSA